MSQILKEFRALSQPSLEALTMAFAKLGKLYRIGGPARVYQIEGENQKGVIFSINDSLMAIGFGWSASPSHIETVYWWNDFSFQAPDYAVDLPESGDITVMVPKIIEMIKGRQLGEVQL